MDENHVSVSEKISDIYDNYYKEERRLTEKRAIAARDTVDHIQNLYPHPLGNVLDVGAGNGSVLQELAQRNLVTEVTALEISTSGIEKIKERDLAVLKDVCHFDGYKIPFGDDAFDTAISIHVLEHVEHERLFLREIGRISKNIFIEVPLEGGVRGKINYSFGHINYYSHLSFRALLETSGLEIVKLQIVTSSEEYERHCYGYWPGRLRYALRNGLLAVLGNHAAELMTYLIVAHCRKIAS
jgi:SAM-dependent methyltransferase